jgi:RHS repeat-associated protein
MRTQRVGYDAQGSADNNTDALMRVHRATFDSVGRPLSATTSDGRTTSVSWDAHDNVTSVTPPGRMAHRFAFTAQDLIESAAAPMADDGDPTERVTWDSNQRPTSVMAPGGRMATIAYDSAGRIETSTTAEGVYRFGYHATSGHLASITNPAGPSIAYTYDGSIPTEVRWTGDVAGTVTRAYDNDFRVSRERVNGANELAYGYDADGLLTSAGPVTLVRNAGNGVVDRVSTGSAQTDLVHDGYGAITRSATRVGATSVFEEELTYDGLGRITRKIERSEGRATTIEYAFDGANRLREVRRDGAVSETYAYDTNGNRTSATVGGQTRMGVVDAQDRLRSYGEFTYTYNREGQWTERRNTSNGQAWRYRYDLGGALREVTLPSGRRIEYVIDALGRRVGRRVDGVLATRWLYRDGLRPIAELDSMGAVQSVFVYGSRANVPNAIVRGGRAYRIVSDHLGSVRRVVDAATGMVVQRLEYDAYGRVTEDSAPGWQPFGYAGGLYDSDTGLVRFGARDYDAISGRWTAKDPSGLSGGLNVYEYAAGDPVDFFDMDGHAILVIQAAFDIQARLVNQAALAIGGLGTGCDEVDVIAAVVGAVFTAGVAAFWGIVAKFAVPKLLAEGVRKPPALDLPSRVPTTGVGRTFPRGSVVPRQELDDINPATLDIGRVDAWKNTVATYMQKSDWERIVVQADGVIHNGHHRVAAALLQGRSVRVVVNEELGGSAGTVADLVLH